MPTRIQSMALLLSAMLVNSALAQYPTLPGGIQQANGMAQQQMSVEGGVPAYGGPVNYGRYPQLQSSLYPTPVQHSPPWNGQTVITNQAFAPHEMLYPHTYNAMYGPFYYKVRGGWVWTPFGMRQHENWKLEGTTVTVKYRAKVPLLTKLSTSIHAH